MSLRLRFSLLAGLAVFLVVALFGSGVYVVVALRLFDTVDGTLGQYANVVNNRLLHPRPVAADNPNADTPSLPRLPSDPNAFAIVYDGDGNPNAESDNAAGLSIKLPPSALQAVERGQTRVLSLTSS